MEVRHNQPVVGGIGESERQSENGKKEREKRRGEEHKTCPDLVSQQLPGPLDFLCFHIVVCLCTSKPRL